MTKTAGAVLAVEAGNVVVVDCSNPKEKLWGVLVRLDLTGVVVRGLDINSVEDWLRQEKAGEPSMIGPSTVFIPMHRVHRVYLDESSAAVSSFADRYAEFCCGDVRDALFGRTAEDEEVQ